MSAPTYIMVVRISHDDRTKAFFVADEESGGVEPGGEMERVVQTVLAHTLSRLGGGWDGITTSTNAALDTFAEECGMSDEQRGRLSIAAMAASYWDDGISEFVSLPELVGALLRLTADENHDLEIAEASP
jgi:hypothetical protein